MKSGYKLNVQDVLEIRDGVADGDKCSTWARKKKISLSMVVRIVSRKAWAHVQPCGAIYLRKRVRGERNARAKLTFPKVRKILMRVAKGESNASIARDLKLSCNTIRYIAIGKTWKHVPSPAGMEASRHVAIGLRPPIRGVSVHSSSN